MWMIDENGEVVKVETLTAYPPDALGGKLPVDVDTKDGRRYHGAKVYAKKTDAIVAAGKAVRRRIANLETEKAALDAEFTSLSIQFVVESGGIHEAAAERKRLREKGEWW